MGGGANSNFCRIVYFYFFRWRWLEDDAILLLSLMLRHYPSILHLHVAEASITMDSVAAEAPPEVAEAAGPTSPIHEAATATAAKVQTSAKKKGSTSTKTKSTKVSAYDTKFVENLTLLKTILRDDGFVNYSALDDAEEQKHMQNFVKVQRRAYRQRENNEPTPMTDDRFRLLSEANFPFEPYQGNAKGELFP